MKKNKAKSKSKSESLTKKKEPITVSKKTIETIEGLELFTTPAAAKVFQSWAKKEGVNVAIRDIQHYFRYGLTPERAGSTVATAVSAEDENRKR